MEAAAPTPMNEDHSGMNTQVFLHFRSPTHKLVSLMSKDYGRRDFLLQQQSSDKIETRPRGHQTHLQSTSKPVWLLGYIMPFTTWTNILVQSLWDKKHDWDDPQLPQDLLTVWHEWESELIGLEKISAQVLFSNTDLVLLPAIQQFVSHLMERSYRSFCLQNLPFRSKRCDQTLLPYLRSWHLSDVMSDLQITQQMISPEASLLKLSTREECGNRSNSRNMTCLLQEATWGRLHGHCGHQVVP